jgi:hypothetical protein
MSKRAMLFLAAVVIAGPVAGCADAPWQPPAYETAIKRYYEAHASERNGQCLAPYIDGFTTLEVVEDTPERMVVDARYLYRDRLKDGSDGDGMMLGCVSYGQRSFVLTRSDDRLQVMEMSGPRRN